MVMKKAELAEACWTALADHMPHDISLEKLAEACDISVDEAVLHGGDVTSLILAQLEMLDSQSLRAGA